MQQEERKNQRADAEADLRASRHASPPRTCCRLLKCGASGKSAATNRSGRCAPRYFPATGTGMIAPHDLQSESTAVRPALRATRPQVAAGGSIVAGHYHCRSEEHTSELTSLRRI